MADKFHDFVIVLATQQPLLISDELSDSRAVPSEPSSLSQTPTCIPAVPKRKRSPTKSPPKAARYF